MLRLSEGPDVHSSATHGPCSSGASEFRSVDSSDARSDGRQLCEPLQNTPPSTSFVRQVARLRCTFVR